MSDKGISAFAKRAYDLITKKEQPKARTPNTPDVQAARGMVVDRDRFGSSNEVEYGRYKAEPGQTERGNVNLYGRPGVDNKDGSVSTVRSMSFSDGPGREVLVPTAYDGAVHTPEESVGHYRATGQHMGVFSSPKDATRSAQKIHDDYQAGRYADEGGHVMEERPHREPDTVSGTVTEHNPTKNRPAASSVGSPTGGYERQERPEDPDARFAEHLKKAQAQGHPFIQEVRMPNDITDRYNQGFDRISDAVAPVRESKGMRLAADKVANAGRRLQNATITRSQEAMGSGYGRMAADLYNRVDGQDAVPRRLVAKAVEKLAPDVPDIEFDQPTELPDITVEGEDSLKKKK